MKVVVVVVIISRLSSATHQPHPSQRLVLGHIHCFRQCEITDLKSCCMVLSHAMQSILMVSSSPLEGELTGSSWHLHYPPYVQCAKKGSGNVIGLLQ